MATLPLDIPENQIQTGFQFPQLLTEKYKPAAISDFVGLDKIKNQMRKFAANPFPSNWFFLGNSGTGKTSMSFAVGRAIPAEIHHVPARECTLEVVQELKRQCHYAPRMANTWTPCKMHLIIVDEADQMSYPAQLAFLSVLDFTDRPPNTVVIFTGNDTKNLDPDGSGRFMSRVQKLEFSSYGISQQVAALLQDIWTRETDNPIEAPNFNRIVKESNNNVRESLMRLQSEILAV